MGRVEAHEVRDVLILNRSVSVWPTRVGIAVSKEAWLPGIESGRRACSGTRA